MAAPGAHIDRPGPAFFFDQANGGDRMETATKSSQKEGQECKRLDNQSLCEDKPNADCDPVDAYRRAAPHLLDELAHLLSQHKWSEKGRIPHGIVNILNESWHDMTAGALLHLKSPTLTDKRPKPKSSLKTEQRTPSRASAREETRSLCVSVRGSVDPKPQVRSHVRTCKVNFSEGGLIQPQLLSCDGPYNISVCQWVVERLQAARNPQDTQASEQDLKKPLILRHYGDVKVKAETRGLVTPLGVPQRPVVKLLKLVHHKLHYRIDDGSSFIYYPSGRVAVCQSHSGWPCGGFYTNVFSGGERPITLATITAFGHGAVTNPLSSTITAAWDQDGGRFYDDGGNVTKKWSWQKCDSHTVRNKIPVQVSDQISVTLLSRTSATLTFTCDDESVELPLSSLSYSQSKHLTEETPNSDSAQDVEEKRPPGISESNENLRQTPEFLQMFRAVEGPVKLPAESRREGHAGRELKRLQQRVRDAVEDWLDYYRLATGIRCPDTPRTSAAPLRTRPTRTIQFS